MVLCFTIIYDVKNNVLFHCNYFLIQYFLTCVKFILLTSDYRVN